MKIKNIKKCQRMTFSTGRVNDMFVIECENNIDKYRREPYRMAKERRGYFGFVPWLKELFEELHIPYKDYQNSLIIEIKDKAYALFQHKKNNLWFYFSDIFKARNFKRFFSRLKKFLMENISKDIRATIEKFEKAMFDEFGELVEYQKEKYGNKARFVFRYNKEDNSYFINFFGIFKITFKPYTRKLSFTFSTEFYPKYTKEAYKMVNRFLKYFNKYFDAGYNGRMGMQIRTMKPFILLPL